MSKEIVINKHSLQVKQYNGQNVVTFKEIDLCHERPSGTAKRNFNKNKKHFTEGTDYFTIPYSEFSTNFVPNSSKAGNPNNTVTLITESGYLMLVKSFTDELSWNVQRMLVNSYFNYKEEKPYEYFDKTYNGEPVLSLTDIEHLTGIDTATANCHLKKHGIMSSEYYLLSDGELVNFKKENPKTPRLASKIFLVTKRGFTVLCDAYKIKVEMPKCFAEKKFEQLKLPETAEDKLASQIKTAREKTIVINALLDKLEYFAKHKGESNMRGIMYDLYAPAICRVLGCFQIDINE